MHGHARRTDRMALGLETAGQVDRQRPSARHGPLVHHPRALPFRRQPQRLIGHEFRDGEAVMDLGEGQIPVRDTGGAVSARKGLCRPGKVQHAPPRQRQKIVRLHGGAKPDGMIEPGRHVFGHQHQRGDPVRDEGAVAHPQQRRDHRIAIRDGVAELRAQRLAHMGKRIGHGVPLFFAAIFVSVAE